MLAQLFFCKACEEPFCTSLTAADIKAGAKVLCPLCGSEDVAPNDLLRDRLTRDRLTAAFSFLPPYPTTP